MIGFNGGLIGGLTNARNTTTLKSNPGMWTLAEQRKAIFSVPTAWPVSGVQLPALGSAFGGGFFAGTISHSQDGVPTHGLIVAPRAEGASGTGYTLTTLHRWKTTNTTSTGANSSFDGYANTLAMVEIGIDLHPAAQFCTTRTIGGFSDWYLPSRYEMDIAYYNLKPTNQSNDLTSDRTAGVPGINPFSVPLRNVSYTASVPGQTTVGNFQNGASEPFQQNSYWTSTDSTTFTAFWMSMNTGAFFTGDFGFTKNDTHSVRAFRRVVL